MASGWARDGAVQEQIDADIADAISHARNRLAKGDKSLTHCEDCDDPIPEARRRAVPGVRRCVECQAEMDAPRTGPSAYNRRGSKGSQMK